MVYREVAIRLKNFPKVLWFFPSFRESYPLSSCRKRIYGCKQFFFLRLLNYPKNRGNSYFSTLELTHSKNSELQIEVKANVTSIAFTAIYHKLVNQCSSRCCKKCWSKYRCSSIANNIHFRCKVAANASGVGDATAAPNIRLYLVYASSINTQQIIYSSKWIDN